MENCMEPLTQFSYAILPIIGGLLGVAAAFLVGRKSYSVKDYIPAGVIMLVCGAGIPIMLINGSRNTLFWWQFVSTLLMIGFLQGCYFATAWMRCRNAKTVETHVIK